MNKRTLDALKRCITIATKSQAESQALANRFGENEFEFMVLSDEAAWAANHQLQALTRILFELEQSDAPPKGHKQKKPQVRKRTRMGNG